MKPILLILAAVMISSCAPMPESLRSYGEPKYQPIWTVLKRSSEV